MELHPPERVAGVVSIVGSKEEEVGAVAEKMKKRERNKDFRQILNLL